MRFQSLFYLPPARVWNIAENLLTTYGANSVIPAFRRPILQDDLVKRFNVVLSSISEQQYATALKQLQGDILPKLYGCATTGAPDKGDWIIDCPDQSMVYTPLLNIIAETRALSGG